MLYRFKSQATADIVMLQATGELLLRIMGKTPEPKGIITVAQMPAALDALARAVADSEAAPAAAQEEDSDDYVQEQRDSVQLRQRAAPLVTMLKEASAAGKDVVWGV